MLVEEEERRADLEAVRGLLERECVKAYADRLMGFGPLQLSGLIENARDEQERTGNEGEACAQEDQA